MKISKTIKSRARLASTGYGRAYGTAQRRVAMGIVVAGALWGYVPTARAEGDFWCAEDALLSGCSLNDPSESHATPSKKGGDSPPHSPPEKGKSSRRLGEPGERRNPRAALAGDIIQTDPAFARMLDRMARGFPSEPASS